MTKFKAWLDEWFLIELAVFLGGVYFWMLRKRAYLLHLADWAVAMAIGCLIVGVLSAGISRADSDHDATIQSQERITFLSTQLEKTEADQISMKVDIGDLKNKMGVLREDIRSLKEGQGTTNNLLYGLLGVVLAKAIIDVMKGRKERLQERSSIPEQEFIPSRRSR